MADESLVGVGAFMRCVVNQKVYISPHLLLNVLLGELLL